ncbi:DUF5104 domain-containing protein [Sedimentibacter sp. zth1]|uniref:DUF5104 domain-containing protein n=1 Tax=Sedimentibacter sp. zth1 TaxID=2816908 RepID=UPI001A926310|nr:DUF5104 domain-containing protein [Sedimentibacter sp. zth1]QSX06705.1 DUF5104 domain-containing protein [Sedimentibacter sp. zth1]
MKKKCFLIILSLSIIVMVSCSKDDINQDSTDIPSNEQLADNTLEKLLKGIVDKDEQSFKDIFSKQVMNEDKDFDIEMEYLFDFFRGDVVSWEKYSGPIVDREKDQDKITIEIKSFYEVKTSEDDYVVFILEYTEDTVSPENIGVYALRIVKEEDRQTQMT